MSYIIPDGDGYSVLIANNKIRLLAESFLVSLKGKLIFIVEYQLYFTKQHPFRFAVCDSAGRFAFGGAIKHIRF